MDNARKTTSFRAKRSEVEESQALMLRCLDYARHDEDSGNARGVMLSETKYLKRFFATLRMTRGDKRTML